MPRQKQPINILEAKKKTHLTKEQIETRKKQEGRKHAPADRLRPPTWLSKEGKKEFRIMMRNLLAMQESASCEMVSNLDVPALALWADAYAEYQKINRIVEAEGMTIATETSKAQHPLLSRKKALFEQMDKIGRQFALSPAARIAITLPPAKDDDKPESKWAKFGAGMSG